MKIKGAINGIPVLVLIDSGSTHCFLDTNLAEKLKLPIENPAALWVTVASGKKLSCAGVCRNINIQLERHSFCVEFFIFSLGEFGAVLGVNWLKTLGPITWNFKDMSMRFLQGGTTIALYGVQKSGTTTSLHLSTLCNNKEGSQGQLSNLLEEFSDIFAEPGGLPPSRSANHKIILEHGANPVVVRPYRYPHAQKDEIERQCADMLAKGLIRPSNSPFSSPVLLVKKSDDTWRFCVDYRALNAKTIKDKFPIPVIDELLEELHGAKYFSKLDLRSGYHQILMDPSCVHMTAFRTHHGHFEFVVMPFGLTNAPSTFQSIMNSVFGQYLRQFILVFFDDILIYSSTWDDHLCHIRTVFSILRQQQFVLKRSKCVFAKKEVSYLGHVVNQTGVKVDEDKIKAITQWPAPNTVKGLRGFLGLTGYYRKFVKDYGTIAAPLTQLLKKNSFKWSDEASRAFALLKTVMTTTPVLALPDFSAHFVVECDASDTGIGAVLHQNGRPLAFFSQPLPQRHKKLPAYEKELIGLAKAVRHWRPYFWGNTFVVRTDHYSLKFLLEQRITTSPQQHWVSKLLGFDFHVEYKAGSTNVVADALSRRDDAEGSLQVISLPQSAIFSTIREEHRDMAELQPLIQKIQQGEAIGPWEFRDGLIWYRQRIYLPKISPSIASIISGTHNANHEGFQKTVHRISRDFFWTGMKRQVQEYVATWLICQRNKVELLKPAGLLQPLPIPQHIWADISMDFVEGLPVSQGKSVLLVVVDRLSKYAHFLALSHPYTAVHVARIFFDHVFKLHGLAETIVTDRDVTFTSSFWKELFRLSGSQLCFTSAYHPQSDGQTEAVNRIVEMYLRCFTGDYPTKWVGWLSWSEYCYNTSFHSSLRTTPFEAVYGRPPPRLLSYCPGLSRIDSVDKELQTRDQVLGELKNRLLQAQNSMKTQYDATHRELQFDVGDKVLLKLQPYRQKSVAYRKNQKLGPRYYGPFLIVSRIGSVAYKLQLPESSKIHPVFHVSSLKKFKGNQEADPVLPHFPLDEENRKPQAILDTRIRNGGHEFLVHWQGLAPSEASWEAVSAFTAQFPSFKFEDKLASQGDGNVTSREDDVGREGAVDNNVEKEPKNEEDEPKRYQRFTHGKFRVKS
ncbi:transposon Ty3-G Gag-Pol polyprotein isoform X1 [Primulina eburnea]|uniref:transposon Ty3-G Gag-Pol polyprotein isoform X1 n=1 Tax=Primulina eburnea TaxID=1245227 RepID=UPI003C6C5592